MKNRTNFFIGKTFILAAICFLGIANASAASSANENYSFLVENLTKKLSADLNNQIVNIELKNVQEYKISKGKIGIKGEGVCVLADENASLPIRFDAKVNLASQAISALTYDIVKTSEYSYAPTSSEEVLMKVLMKQISRDYKTDNIVIAIDAVENAPNSNNEFQGFGEVRIGGFNWSKIKFDVVMDAKSQTAKKIVYKVE